MLEEGRVPHKSNIVYLQFKLLSAHIGFGGQDGGEDDVREPERGKKPVKKMCSMRGAETEQKELREVRISSVCLDLSHSCL